MKILSLLLAAITALALCACAAAPALQVAGMGMTGYDVAVFVDKNAPKGRVDISGNYACSDKVLQRRLRERLRLKGYKGLTAYVFDGHAYMVGGSPNKGWANRAITVASSVQGLSVLTCRFFPLSADPIHDKDRTRQLLKQLRKDPILAKERLGAVVHGTNAVVMGVVDAAPIQDRALDMARQVSGVTDVIDYVVIIEHGDESLPDGETNSTASE